MEIIYFHKIYISVAFFLMLFIIYCLWVNSLFRLSRWNHTKIFSDFSDEETENSDAEYAGTKTVSGRRGKGSSQLKSKASSSRSVVIFIFIIH